MSTNNTSTDYLYKKSLCLHFTASKCQVGQEKFNIQEIRKLPLGHDKCNARCLGHSNW